MKVTVALLLLLSVHLVLAYECQAGWKMFDSDCYQFPSPLETWQVAADYCASIQAHLPYVNSLAEDQWILSIMQRIHFGSFWIGGKYNYRRWRWQPDGFAMDYFNWPFEPRHPKECLVNGAELAYSFGYKWRDAACGELHHFACEKRATKVTVQWGEFNGNRYTFYIEPKSWEEAKAKCAENQAHFPVVENAQVDQWLVAQMNKHSWTHIWLNGTYEAKDRYWEQNPSAEGIGNSKDEGNEPATSKICLALWATVDYNWNEAACANKGHFACQKAV